jgi:hypothetical protein
MKSIRIHCCVVGLLGALAAPAVPAADAAADPIMAAAHYGRGADTDMLGTQIVWRPSCACEFTFRGVEIRAALP